MGKRRVISKSDTEPLYMIGPLDGSSDIHGASGLEVLKAAAGEFKGCTSKDTFYSQKEAAKAALMARVKTGHRNILEYKCRYCPNWHIGHSFSD